MPGKLPLAGRGVRVLHGDGPDGASGAPLAPGHSPGIVRATTAKWHAAAAITSAWNTS